ncbi:hypothetical protein BT96DRAFT_1000207 [Gymnopus androsaceus JB14]|uniref:Uncharacterized protein n=1 Tax=Gymnopus androsaceus JB14 TaxID=1447944 RepID=A0A6A4H5T5_9AGAR|nr:hypothetical protein BT96DRAFT_1000207 [Gymnopus androsaceus JB14]
MTGILANAGIAGPLPDIYNVNGHIKLPPALTPTGHTLRTRNMYNCAAEKFNEDSINMTLDCHNNTSPMDYSGWPLPLFLRKKIVREHLTNAEKSEKDKADKEKAGKSIRGSMVMGKPITCIPGQWPDIDIANIVLYSISNKLYLPINWFTNIHLDHPLTDVPNPNKVQVFDMAKMVALWGLDETYTCLTPLKWQEATRNLLAALLLLCETLSLVEQLTHHTFAGEFEKHRKFFIHYRDLKETYQDWYSFERGAHHDILKGTLFDNAYYIQQVDGCMHAKEAAALMIPPLNPLKRTSDLDLFFNFTKPGPMTKSTYESENRYDSLHNRDDVCNVVNNSNTHAPEHTWQSDTNLVSKRNTPLEPFSSDLSLSVEFLQQMRNVARACAEAQETSINVAREFSKLMDTIYIPFEINVTCGDETPNSAGGTENNDLRKSGVSNIPDQGIGFNRSGYPVDKAHTPCEVWERREDMYPPQYTGRVGYSPTNQRNPQYNCGFQAGSVNQTRNYPRVSEDRKLQGGRSPPGGNGPPGDNGDVDGNGRDDKSCKGKKPARRHRTPWDDSSEGESPPPPPPSSPPSSSEDSSLSDDDWIGAFAPNVEFLDKKVRRNLRRKTIKKLRARTDDDERCESWLKGILREYRKQIWHFCNHETVQSTEMPKGIKIPNPSRFTGSNDVEEFDTWLLALLRWIVISRLVGKVNNDQCVQVVGSFLDKDALRWYNDEVTGLHRSQLNWTFEKVILGLFARFVQATTIHVAAEKFEATEYDPEKGVRAYKAELQWWGSRMTRPPNSYALRKKFLDGLPTSIISEMIERGASPDLATLSKMVKTVERLEDNKALKMFPTGRNYHTTISRNCQIDAQADIRDRGTATNHTSAPQTPTAPPTSDQSLTGPQNALIGNTPDGGPSPTLNSFISGLTPQSQSHLAMYPPQFPFQTQTQGSNPLSFVFGSIPPSAGSNPNFAAGYNPAAMAGTSTPSYSQMPMFGQAPNSVMHPPYPGGSMVNPWTFNESLGTVIHARGTCSQCDAFVSHLLPAFVDDKPSFRAATSGRVDYYRQSAVGIIPAGGDVASLTQRIGELSAELASEQLGYEDLHRKYYDGEDDLACLRDERDRLRVQRDSLKAEVGQLREQVSRRRAHNQGLDSQAPEYDSPDHHGKRKRTTGDGPSTAPMTASSQNKDEEMLSSAGINPVETTAGETEPVLSFPPCKRDPVSPEILPDGGYRTSEGYIVYGNEAMDAQRNDQLGLPIARGGEEAHANIKKAEEVTSAIQYLSLARILRDFDNSGVNTGNLPWPAFRVCRDLYKEVCKVPAGQRNALERTVFSNFFRLRFVEMRPDNGPEQVKERGWPNAPNLNSPLLTRRSLPLLL